MVIQGERAGSTCPHFGDCGGCLWQDVPYEEQLRRKEQSVQRIFQEAGMEVRCQEPILPSPQPFQYRNKMEFTAVPDPDRGLVLGLHRRGRFDAVVDIYECWLPPAEANPIVESIRQVARRYGIRAYDYVQHTGFLRNVVLRFANPPEQWMVLLVTTTPTQPPEEAFLRELAERLPALFPTVRTVAQVINDTWSPVSVGELRVLFGDGVIEQSLCGMRFRISPFAFFQVNWVQLERFFGRILELAQPQPTDIVWDLYCGTGSIALVLACHVRHVYAAELVTSALEDARRNAAMNGVENVSWFALDLHRPAARQTLDALPQPDLLVVDPPRAGIHWRLLQYLLERPAQRMLYVSCNPLTQVRDLKRLLQLYELERLQPVDLFPQTPHVEVIACLRRR